MFKSKMSILVLGIGILLMVYLNPYMKTMDEKLYNLEYSGDVGNSLFTVNSRLMGIKKFGSSLLWINQVLDVGSHDYEADHIRKNSEEISYLDPYFIANYYFSGTVLALIKTYNRHDYGFEILKRGLKYNPEDTHLKSYMGGIVAHSKGDIQSVLESFEEILKEQRDDRLLNIVAYIYEERYKKTNEEKYIKKAIHYWERLKQSKEEKYQNRAMEKLEKYKK